MSEQKFQQADTLRGGADSILSVILSICAKIKSSLFQIPCHRLARFCASVCIMAQRLGDVETTKVHAPGFEHAYDLRGMIISTIQHKRLCQTQMQTSE